MSEIKVSQLPIASDTTTTDSFVVVQAGVTKRITFGTILQNLKSTADIIFNVGAASIVNFIIKNGGVEVFRVYGTNSNIGIKTAAPEADLHITGNIKIGDIGIADDTDGIPAASSNGLLLASSEIVGHPIGAPATLGPITNPIEISKETTLFKAYGASKYELPSGVNGQSKTLILLVQDQSATDSAEINIQSGYGLGFTKITLNSLGDSVSLKFISDKWVVLSNSGGVII